MQWVIALSLLLLWQKIQTKGNSREDNFHFINMDKLPIHILSLLVANSVLWHNGFPSPQSMCIVVANEQQWANQHYDDDFYIYILHLHLLFFFFSVCLAFTVVLVVGCTMSCAHLFSSSPMACWRSWFCLAVPMATSMSCRSRALALWVLYTRSPVMHRRSDQSPINMYGYEAFTDLSCKCSALATFAP